MTLRNNRLTSLETHPVKAPLGLYNSRKNEVMCKFRSNQTTYSERRFLGMALMQ